MKKSIVELFEEFKCKHREVADLHLKDMTNESGKHIEEAFEKCPLRGFLGSLNENMEIEVALEERTFDLTKTYLRKFSWIDYQNNSIVVELLYRQDTVLDELVYRGTR